MNLLIQDLIEEGLIPYTTFALKFFSLCFIIKFHSECVNFFF